MHYMMYYIMYYMHYIMYYIKAIPNISQPNCQCKKKVSDFFGLRHLQSHFNYVHLMQHRTNNQTTKQGRCYMTRADVAEKRVIEKLIIESARRRYWRTFRKIEGSLHNVVHSQTTPSGWCTFTADGGVCGVMSRNDVVALSYKGLLLVSGCYSEDLRRHAARGAAALKMRAFNIDRDAKVVELAELVEGEGAIKSRLANWRVERDKVIDAMATEA